MLSIPSARHGCGDPPSDLFSVTIPHMLIAQALGEYGGGGGMLREFVSSVQTLANRAELGVRDNPWTAVAIVVVFGVWLIRKR